MRAAGPERAAGAAGGGPGEAAGPGQAFFPAGKKPVYAEPSRRLKEILEEELCFWKEGCQVKHPAAVALEGVWTMKNKFSVGSLKPVSQNRNCLLLQPQFYSRHAGMKSKNQQLLNFGAVKT
ncbi:uncharacterized protein C11orf97 homolog [Apus apus]|uniref:uncharacterized protein C11orf97 homolog n=1 Tax=Apus apus TaxID=8895 RepID=UPI0021F8A3B4|nr:uncharacterized protein C11orf97 homolog [Apus apus]